MRIIHINEIQIPVSYFYGKSILAAYNLNTSIHTYPSIDSLISKIVLQILHLINKDRILLEKKVVEHGRYNNITKIAIYENNAEYCFFTCTIFLFVLQ